MITNVHRFAHAILLGWLIVLIGSGCERPDNGGSPNAAGAEQLGRAMQAMDAGQFALALNLADSAEAAGASGSMVAYARGSVFLSMDRLDDAEAAFRNVIALDPDIRGAWLNLGNVAFRRNQFRDAVTAYQQEIAGHPAARPYHALGAAYDELAIADSARRSFEQAIKLDNTYAPALYSLAVLQDTEGNLDAALENATSARQLAPGDQRITLLVGRLQLKDGQVGEAISTLKGVVANQPWNYEAMFSLGQAQRRAGLQEAAQTLARSEELRILGDELALAEEYSLENPNSFSRRIEYGDALRRLGRYQDALRAYQVALALRPDDIDVRSNVATLTAQSGDPLNAVRLFGELLRQDSTHASSWLNLGLIYHGNGQDAPARRAFAAARRHAGGDQRILDVLGRVGVDR